MHTFDSLCRYPKRKNVSLSNPLTRIRRTRLSQGVGPRNPLAKNRILRSVNRIALKGGEGEGRLRRLVASLGALRPAGVRGGVLLGGRLDQRKHLVLHRLDPVGRLDPGVAVPFRDVGGVVAAVIAA